MAEEEERMEEKMEEEEEKMKEEEEEKMEEYAGKGVEIGPLTLLQHRWR